MENLSVSLKNYHNGSGFDVPGTEAADLSAQQLQELSKALEAGSLRGGDLTGNQTNAGALKTESLESSLKLITFKESDIRFWKRFPKSAAYNTVEEFNQHTSYGTDRGGFNNEGELPEEEDSQYVRKAEKVKYLGVVKSVTHPMQLVSTNVGDIIQKETTNGIMWILRKANKALFYGDDKIVSQEYNGVYAQHLDNDQFGSLEEYNNSDLVIDLRGKSLREANIEAGAQTLLNKFAQPNLLVGPPKVFSDFAKGFYERQRIALGQSGNTRDITTGQHISKFQSMYGLIDFEYDIFAAKGTKFRRSSENATSPKAPAAPTAAGATVVNSDGLSKFSGDTGDYYYAVSAINRYGESALTQVGATVTVANANDSVDLEFTATAGSFTPTAYKVYRSEKNPGGSFANTKMYPIMEVPAAGSDSKRGSLAAGVDGASAGEVRDRNRFLPNTEVAFLTQGDTDVMEFKQLAPLMKMPLAKLSPADRFMVLLYGTPLIYAPSKIIKYINIGSDLT